MNGLVSRRASSSAAVDVPAGGLLATSIALRGVFKPRVATADRTPRRHMPGGALVTPCRGHKAVDIVEDVRPFAASGSEAEEELATAGLLRTVRAAHPRAERNGRRRYRPKRNGVLRVSVPLRGSHAWVTVNVANGASA
jgi:hypothetical protein